MDGMGKRADVDRARLQDAAEVAAARLGDRTAFASLVKRRGPRLYAHARRLTDSAEAAQDVMQEAWIGIWRGLGGLRDDFAFLPWALRIVTWRAAAQIGQQAGQRRLARAWAEEQASLPETGDSAPGPDRDLERAIQQLPRAQAAALALFYGEEMSVAEVAVALDIPPGTVKSRLMHARQKLRLTLEMEGE